MPPPFLLKTFTVLAGFAAVSACIYYAVALWAAARFAAPRRSDSNFTPPVSLLKPLRGLDPGMYENLRSHCLQLYPEYELIFGVATITDPAVRLVQQLSGEFPARAIRLVVCEQVQGTNLKVSKLAQMLPHARYDHLLINDADIRVPPDYLKRVIAPLSDSTVGLVTCLYRGVPAKTLGSRLESLGISTDFISGVLVANELEGMSFGLGATLAFPRKALDAIGGFEPLLDYLADDFELGNRIARAGMNARLSSMVVEDHLPDYDLASFLRHQLRWARTIRDSRRWGYLGLVFSYGLPWGLMAVAFSRGEGWSWMLLAVVAALRFSLALLVSLGILQDGRSVRDFWLLPLRDLIAFGIWAAAFAGDRVAWRGEEYVLEKGKLRPL